MNTIVMWVLVFAAIVLVGGTLLTIASVQRRRVEDKELNQTTARHRIVANPILIAYILFPIAIIIGVAILLYLL